MTQALSGNTIISGRSPISLDYLISLVSTGCSRYYDNQADDNYDVNNKMSLTEEASCYQAYTL